MLNSWKYLLLKTCKKNKYLSHFNLLSVTMDQQKTTTLPRENVTLEGVLCSPHVHDIILITPAGMNDLPITSQYQEIPMKQIKKNISITNVIFIGHTISEERTLCHLLKIFQIETIG